MNGSIDVDAVETALRKCEAGLESIGRDICSAKNGRDSWNAINRALENVRQAIRCAWKMRTESHYAYDDGVRELLSTVDEQYDGDEEIGLR